MTFITVGGMEFSVCERCEQPLDATSAARAEFRLHDQMYDELRTLTQQAQALVGAIGHLRKQMEGGYQGMRDPFRHEADD